MKPAFSILALTVAVGCILLFSCGCAITRNIEPIDPVQQVHLDRLDHNLDYTDPDAGRTNYLRGD